MQCIYKLIMAIWLLFFYTVTHFFEHLMSITNIVIAMFDKFIGKTHDLNLNDIAPAPHVVQV